MLHESISSYLVFFIFVLLLFFTSNLGHFKVAVVAILYFFLFVDGVLKIGMEGVGVNFEG